MEERYKETFESWDKLASLYQEKFMDLDLYNGSYDWFCHLMDADKPVLLDIGCGPGNITKYLLSKRPGMDITGIDISPNMIALAKINNPDAHFELMDVRHISRIRTKFDGIISGFCLPYLTRADGCKLIEDACRLLNPKGVIYFSFVQDDTREFDCLTAGTGDRTYFYYYRLEDLKEQIRKNKCGDIKVFELAYRKSENLTETHTVLIARKISD